MKAYDVVIIGAGLAGLTAASILAAKESKKVLLVEKEDFIGGRCISFTGGNGAIMLEGQPLDISGYKRKLAASNTRLIKSDPELSTIFEDGLFEGYSFEAGIHITFWGNKSKIAALLNYLNRPIDLPGNQGFVILDPEQDKTFELLSGESFKWMSNASNRTAKKLLYEMAIASPAQIEAWRRISFGEWMRQRTNDSKVWEFLAAVASFHMAMGDPDMMSAGEFIQFMNDAGHIGMNLISGSTGIVPKPGFIRLTEILADVVKEQGGDIWLESAVREVLVEDNRVVGLKVKTILEDKIVKTDQVVCTIPPKSMFGIIPENHFPAEFVRHIKEDFWSPGLITGFIGMKRNLFELANLPPKSWVLIPAFVHSSEGFLGDVDCTCIYSSAFSPSLAPAGKNLMVIGMALAEHEASDPQKVQLVFERAEEHLQNVFPTWKEDKEWAIYTSSPTCYGDWPPVGEKRPSNRSPWIKGLYFAGDSYGETVKGSGMDVALHSGITCVDEMMNKKYINEIFESYHQ